MLNSLSCWRSGTAALLALGICTTTLAPMVVIAPATAQFESPLGRDRNWFVRLPVGTTIPATYRGAERIVIKPEESLPLTVSVTEDVLSRQGRVAIPRGSKIEGQLEPEQGGTRFVARDLILPDGTTMDIFASSDVISRKETLNNSARSRAILTGALVGGATATVISAIVGELGVMKSLAGAGAGALGGFLLGGRRSSAEVVIVDPKTDLNLTLDSDLRVARVI
uniref:Uncharacterized protein n=1 Tax=Cyanothece sp. (strain PCC 7425 / ATCC 29141) TaxID=395961 RepID=B8HY96_CYAP4